MEIRREQFPAEQVESIYLEIDCADLDVRMIDGTDFKIEAETEETNAECHCELSDGKLEVYYNFHHRKKHFHINQKTGRITLEIPRNHAFKEFELELGAGNADLRDAEICCDRMYMEAGAGNVRTGSITVHDEVKIEVGAGNAVFGNVQAKNACVECGVGQFVMNGKVDAGVDVECGVGKCELNLAGKETDYNYDISCGIGKVSVNGNRISGMGGGQQQTHTEASGHIKVSCGVGNVMITIA